MTGFSAHGWSCFIGPVQEIFIACRISTISVLIEMCKINLRCAVYKDLLTWTSEGSDQPRYSYFLTWAFNVQLQNLRPRFFAQSVHKKDMNQTAMLCRLIRTCAYVTLWVLFFVSTTILLFFFLTHNLMAELQCPLILLLLLFILWTRYIIRHLHCVEKSLKMSAQKAILLCKTGILFPSFSFLIP